MSAVGAVIVTADGINALVEAESTGRSVKPKYFRFSLQDLVLDPELSAEDIHGWLTRDISVYKQIDEHTVEFVCDVPPTEATHYARIAGLYLDDGTLFAVAKPPYPFPPALRQTLKIQVQYRQVGELMDFRYLPHHETEQDLNLLNTGSVLGLKILRLADLVRSVQSRVAAIWAEVLRNRGEMRSKIDNEERERKRADETERRAREHADEQERINRKDDVDDARQQIIATTAALGALILKK